MSQDAAGTTRRLEFGPTAAMQAQHRATKLARILARLRQGPATTFDLCRITPAYSQRMGDLKRLGWKILRQDHVGPDGEYSLYVLVGEPPEAA